MAGGLMQLVAYGAQDVYLTGNPQITFFKVVYRRHTNFSMEAIEHPLNSSPNFGRKSTVCITRNGEAVFFCFGQQFILGFFWCGVDLTYMKYKLLVQHNFIRIVVE